MKHREILSNLVVFQTSTSRSEFMLCRLLTAIHKKQLNSNILGVDRSGWHWKMYNRVVFQIITKVYALSPCQYDFMISK